MRIKINRPLLRRHRLYIDTDDGQALGSVDLRAGIEWLGMGYRSQVRDALDRYYADHGITRRPRPFTRADHIADLRAVGSAEALAEAARLERTAAPTTPAPVPSTSAHPVPIAHVSPVRVDHRRPRARWRLAA